jgi:hypothetical protein
VVRFVVEGVRLDARGLHGAELVESNVSLGFPVVLLVGGVAGFVGRGCGPIVVVAHRRGL